MNIGNRFNSNLKRICEEVGIRYRSSHKMRFYGISACADNLEDMRMVQKIAGHSTLKMTEHYVDKGNRDRKMIRPECWDEIMGTPVKKDAESQ